MDEFEKTSLRVIQFLGKFVLTASLCLPSLSVAKKNNSGPLLIRGVLQEKQISQSDNNYKPTFRWFWLSCIGKTCEWSHVLRFSECYGFNTKGNPGSSYPLPPTTLRTNDKGSFQWIDVKQVQEGRVTVTKKVSGSSADDMFNYEIEFDCTKHGPGPECFITKMKGTTKYPGLNGKEDIYSSELFEDMSGADGRIAKCSKN